MAVVTRKSTQITNRDAVPRVINNPGATDGMLRGFAGTLETVSGDDIASVYIIGSIPSNAVMQSLRLYCDDVGTTATADVGLYQTTANGGAVVDQDFFASAVDIHSGALNGTDILYEAASAFPIENSEKRLWECISGLTADPGLLYDVALTLTAASDAAATITLKGSYAQ